MNQWYLGTIGFSYKDWVGPFYPAGTPQRGYLAYYCKAFNTVEVDTTFYSIPKPKIVQSWYKTSPANFQFCVKTPRRITHELGLRNAQELMVEFIDSLHDLGNKLGPILIQLPPRYSQENYSILSEFIESLPRIHRYAIEFRHVSWYNEKTAHLLSQNQVCWVSSEFPGLPRDIVPTTSYLYIRWIGINNTYHHHSHERVEKTSELHWWLKQILPCFAQIPVVYGFFNNDYAGFAAGTCYRFKQIAGLGIEDDSLLYQGRLF